MPADTRIRTFANASEMRGTYQAARARLMEPPRDPVQSNPATVSAPIAPDPPPSRLAAYPAVADIIDAVCGATGLTSQQLLTDIHSDIAVEARRLAAALVVRRLPIARAAAAEHFGILEEAVVAAIRRIDLTLVARAIPRNADLVQTVRLLVDDWQFDHELRPGVPEIKRAVCAAFGISRAAIESARREAHLVRPRHFAMALARHLSTRSLPFIGRHFGGRDHTTVMNAVRKMQPVIVAIAARLAETATVDDWARAGRVEIDAMAPNKPGRKRRSEPG